MNKIVVSDNINIENMIYEIRGKQVMLDSDLARLYGCKNGTKSLNLAVKRHINRFPERFMFQLTKEEYSSIYSRFQFETLNKNNQKQGLNIKYLPYVFTEQGVAMLSAILKTDVAEEISIKIMDAFVAMKKIINTSLIEQKYFNELTIKNTKDIKLLQESFDKLNTKESNNHIFYEGQIYDSYSLLIDILSRAKKEIIIIDNYAGKKLFDIIKNINVKVKIYTENIDNISKEKYEKQYNNLEIINTNIFHDRFIIIDNKVLYHSGASFKDLGKKCFAITKMEDNNILKEESRPYFWRASTNNDRGFKNEVDAVTWRNPNMHLVNIKIENYINLVNLVVDIELDNKSAVTYVYSLDGNSKLKIQQVLNPNRDLAKIPAISDMFILKEEFKNITYYGRGEIENYWDKYKSAKVGLYEDIVTEKMVNYLQPQENGAKTDVRYLEIKNEKVDKGEEILKSIVKDDILEIRDNE